MQLPDEAINDLTRATGLKPSHPKAHKLLGDAYAMKGDMDTAAFARNNTFFEAERRVAFPEAERRNFSGKVPPKNPPPHPLSPDTFIHSSRTLQANPRNAPFLPVTATFAALPITIFYLSLLIFLKNTIKYTPVCTTYYKKNLNLL